MVIAQITNFTTDALSKIAESFSHISGGEAIIFDIAIILILATILAFVARILKQPLVPAYVITGLIIGPLVLGLVRNIELVYAFSEIGIAFLLFTAGLEISFKKIREANLKKIALIGTLQILAIFFLVLFLGKYFDLTQMQAVYIGIIMAFGSTMVDIKLLADKGELVTMHGRLVLGILLLQDLVAIIAIVIFMSGGFAIVPISTAIAKLLAILLIAILLQKLVLNKLFRFAARSKELLLLSALAVLFLFILLTYISELSIVIGAFIAGVSLANSPFKFELESRISPLRDFFSILFFVALGMQIVFSGVSTRMNLFWLLIIGALVVKPLITLFLLRSGGYKPRTSFLTAASLAQLSEFSLIIGMLGVTMGVLDSAIFSTVILATIITMAVTTYFIEYKSGMHEFFKKPLKIFNFLPTKENLTYVNKKDKTILLVGAHRMGSVLLKHLIKHDKRELLVLDYNPEIISALKRKKISSLYGDLGSPELIETIDINKLKLTISTVPDTDENLRLLKKIKGLNPKTKVILTAPRIGDALELYEKGADYVILPKVIAGEEVTDILHSNKKKFARTKANHIAKLKEIHKILY